MTSNELQHFKGISKEMMTILHETSSEDPLFDDNSNSQSHTTSSNMSFGSRPSRRSKSGILGRASRKFHHYIGRRPPNARRSESANTSIIRSNEDDQRSNGSDKHVHSPMELISPLVVSPERQNEDLHDLSSDVPSCVVIKMSPSPPKHKSKTLHRDSPTGVHEPIDCKMNSQSPLTERSLDITTTDNEQFPKPRFAGSDALSRPLFLETAAIITHIVQDTPAGIDDLIYHPDDDYDDDDYDEVLNKRDLFQMKSRVQGPETIMRPLGPPDLRAAVHATESTFFGVERKGKHSFFEI